VLDVEDKIISPFAQMETVENYSDFKQVELLRQFLDNERKQEFSKVIKKIKRK
jgi:hypothetical protein